MLTEDENQLLRPSEVAAIYGVCVDTIKRYHKRGWLQAIKTPGGHRRYRLSDVKAAMKRTDP